MNLSVGGKLWLAFFCTLTLTVLTIYLLLQNNLKRSFLDYTSVKAIQRLEILQQALVNIHQAEGSFTQLSNDPKRWLNIKAIVFSDKTTVVDAPSEPVLERASSDHYYREFVSTISLFDENKGLVLGVIKPGNTLSWIPLLDNNTTIGFIGFVKPEFVERLADRRFMAKQLTFFAVISLVVLIISIGVATLLTRRISHPIKRLSEHTEALALGDYTQRCEVSSRDEIGQLGNNFNTLAQTLEANEQSQANWIADISHEMRTPVTVLKAQIEAMQDGIRPTNSKSLGLLAQKVEGLNALVDDLFELSLSDIGALSYQKAPFELDALTARTVECFQSKAIESELTLSCIIQQPPAKAWVGDQTRIEQLLSNLIENAIRYTHSGGTVEVELIYSSKTVSLLVRDSAPTVDPDQREKIFERLHRVEGSRSRNTGGAGLGLAICRNIVLAHQGHISAEDSSQGGICIRVELPLATL